MKRLQSIAIAGHVPVNYICMVDVEVIRLVRARPSAAGASNNVRYESGKDIDTANSN